MSPIMGSIALAVIVGALLLIVGIVRRKKVLIALGAPAAGLLIGWYVIASRAPDPETEFARFFGAENRAAVSDIRTFKPTLMDGHFMSFHVSQADFNSRISKRFKPSFTTTNQMLRFQSRPAGWPAWIEEGLTTLTAEVDHREMILVYGLKEQTAFASIAYDPW